MAEFFTREYMYLWAAVLALALFLPVRHLIWVLYMRRAQAKQPVDEAEKGRLKRRAAITSALLCGLFAVLYTAQLFSGEP